MSTINPVMESLSIKHKTEQRTASDELGQKQFLELMIAQLKNQDPLSPQENGEFIAQLAQFSSVESLDNLNNRFEEFASGFSSNQALQASSLVGRSVTIDTDVTLYRRGSVISGAVDVPQSTSDMKISIYNADSGNLIKQIPLGSVSKGEMVFRWDGANFEVNGNMIEYGTSGATLPPEGKYRIVAESKVDGKVQQLDMALSANVNSVTVNSSGALVLNLAGLGPVSIRDVKQFN